MVAAVPTRLQMRMAKDRKGESGGYWLLNAIKSPQNNNLDVIREQVKLCCLQKQTLKDTTYS